MCIHVHMAVKLEECNADTDDRTIQFANCSICVVVILCGVYFQWKKTTEHNINNTNEKKRKEKS